MTDFELLVTQLPDEATNPRWTNDPYHWEFFVPELLRDGWGNLDRNTKAAVYLTAKQANSLLRESGVFDH